MKWWSEKCCQLEQNIHRATAVYDIVSFPSFHIRDILQEIPGHWSLQCNEYFSEGDEGDHQDVEKLVEENWERTWNIVETLPMILVWVDQVYLRGGLSYVDLFWVQVALDIVPIRDGAGVETLEDDLVEDGVLDVGVAVEGHVPDGQGDLGRSPTA